MSKPFVSIHRAGHIGTAILLVGLAINAYTGIWWPDVMLSVGLSLAVRQFLLGKIYEALLSCIIFGGIYLTVHYQLAWLPALFIIAALYFLFKAAGHPETEIEDEEETEQEIEEDTKR